MTNAIVIEENPNRPHLTKPDSMSLSADFLPPKVAIAFHEMLAGLPVGIASNSERPNYFEHVGFSAFWILSLNGSF
jgi:hypothetical protein